MANRLRNLAKERLWRERLERFLECGLTVRAFCQQEQIKEAAFYFWKRTIAERDGGSDSKTASVSATHVPAFVPMVLADQAISRQGIEILLAGGRVLRLPESVSAERLAEVVHALETIAAGRQQSGKVRGVR